MSQSVELKEKAREDLKKFIVFRTDYSNGDLLQMVELEQVLDYVVDIASLAQEEMKQKIKEVIEKMEGEVIQVACEYGDKHIRRDDIIKVINQIS